jgi:hypothetical protein
VNLRRRIAALERRLISEPILLMMPDDSTASISGHSDLLNLLVVAAGGANISSEHAARPDLIRRSTDAIEPGGGRLIELIRCCVLGPVERECMNLGEATRDDGHC